MKSDAIVIPALYSHADTIVYELEMSSTPGSIAIAHIFDLVRHGSDVKNI